MVTSYLNPHVDSRVSPYEGYLFVDHFSKKIWFTCHGFWPPINLLLLLCSYRYYNNAYFAKVGGISLMEMNYLEVDFLFGVGFELNVTPVIFSSYCSTLQREMYLESPASPPRLHCCLTEEESSSCQQKQQLAV